eukprot:6192351-Pleurochrysis_carterae.AAC.3
MLHYAISIRFKHSVGRGAASVAGAPCSGCAGLPADRCRRWRRPLRCESAALCGVWTTAGPARRLCPSTAPSARRRNAPKLPDTFSLHGKLYLR